MTKHQFSLTCNEVGVGNDKKLIIFSNGKEVANYFEGVLNGLDISRAQKEGKLPLHPVTLLLLDINMPILTGIEALVLIKNKYRIINEQYNQIKGNKVGLDEVAVIRPLICYYSQYDRDTMPIAMTDDEMADLYLEKPLPASELASLLRLINIL